MKLEDREDRQSKVALERRDGSIPTETPALSEGIEEAPDHDQMIKKVMYEIREKHTYARISMGESAEELTPCGSLMFKNSEFYAYRKLLEDGALLSTDIKVIFVDSAAGSNSHLPKVK